MGDRRQFGKGRLQGTLDSGLGQLPMGCSERGALKSEQDNAVHDQFGQRMDDRLGWRGSRGSLNFSLAVDPKISADGTICTGIV